MAVNEEGERLNMNPEGNNDNKVTKQVTSLTVRNPNSNEGTTNGDGKEVVSKNHNSVSMFRKGSLQITPRIPLSIVPATKKPTFMVFCDDEATQGPDEGNFVRSNLTSTGRQPLAPLKTEFSVSKEDEENIDPKKDKPDSGNDDEVIFSIGFSSRSGSSSADDDLDIENFFESEEDTNIYLTPPERSEKESHEDRMHCHPDYKKDIYHYMRAKERIVCPRPNYMSKQTDINTEMRLVLVDWLTDVVAEYDLSLETLHLAVSVVDRTLSVVDCPRSKLQLIGATAVMIAAKFEEIYPPEVKEYVYITDDTYSSRQILRMETVILSSIRFQVSAPTSNWFGSRLARIARASKRTTNAMDYLLQLALLDHNYIGYRSSVLACAALCMANIITGYTPWPAELAEETEVSVEDMIEPLSQLLCSFSRAPCCQHKAVFEKYSDMKFDSVALITAPSCLPAIK